MVRQMLSRKQLEIGVECLVTECDKCGLDNPEGIGCVGEVAQTALGLMDKLEKAKVLLKAADICSCCIHNQNKMLIALPKEHPCNKCHDMKEGSLWEFNEKLLEVEEGGQ